MSSISSVSGMSTLASYASVKNTQKTQTSLVDKLFEKLDTNQQGFVDKSELQAALTSTSKSDSGSSSNADDLFAKIDADGDGKITKQELGNALQSMMGKMDDLVAKMRAHGGRDKADSTQNDEGFTKDQLVQMAKDTIASNPKRSAFMSNIADNFDKTDANGDGKVTRDEAVSYAKSTDQSQAVHAGGGAKGAGGPPPGGGSGSAVDSSSDATASTVTDPADTNGDGKVSAKEAVDYLLSQLAASDDSSSTVNASSTTSKSSGFNAQIAKQILQLVHAYGGASTAANDASTASVSVSA